MTHRQYRSLARYVSLIAAEMGLRDWTLSFPHEASEDGTLAEVDTTYGRKHATIRFCADWMTRPPEEQRHAVIHELLHVHFAQERQAVHDAFAVLTHDASSLAADAYRLGHEYGVDGVADAIAHFYPLWEGA